MLRAEPRQTRRIVRRLGQSCIRGHRPRLALFRLRVQVYRLGFARCKSDTSWLRGPLSASMRVVILESVNAIATRHGELLEQLCDVSGVLGALLVSSDGVLLAQTLPPELAASAKAVALRLPLLLEALGAGRPLDSYILRFSEHRLYLRSLEGAFLGVLAELSCDAALLKMTLTIAGKRLTCLDPH